MQEVKIIPMIYDKAFKSILTSKEVRSYLIDIIADVIKIDKEEIRKNIVFKQNEHNLLGINEKRKTSDLIVEISYGVINLEMNKDWYDGLFDRNHEYISKIRENILKEEKRYNKLKKVIQINFDNFNIYKTEEIILKFEMMNEKGIREKVNIESYHVILPNARKKYYNEGIRNALVERLVIMTMEKEKELEELIEKNMELKPVGEKIIEISRDEELQGIYDRQEHERMVRNSIMATKLEDSYHKGVNKGIKESAKKMKLKNISIEDIIDITGLSKEEIEKL
mgnify:CR=1 FL=1